MNNDEIVQFAFCWFDKEQWELLAEIDPDGVDDTYEEWRKSANDALSELQANGQRVKKVSIKISLFQQWCHEKRLEPNSSSRSQYAVELMKNK